MAIFLFYFNGFAETKASLQTVTDSLLSQQFKVHVALKGKLVYSESISNNGFEVKQIFEKTANPYFFKMSVTLCNQSRENFFALPADSLIVSVLPVFNSKSLFSEISKIECIASVNGEIKSYREESKTAVKLQWSIQTLNWAGFENRYFALLILPYKPAIYLPFTRANLKFALSATDTSVIRSDITVLTFNVPLTSIASRKQCSWEFLIFTGPKSKDVLSSGTVKLNAILFSGLWSWMRWICLGLLGLLSYIHSVIPDWGLSIIFLALIVRIILFPLARKAMKSQQQFVEVQKNMSGELLEIKKKYKGGEQSERILQLYKKHKVSPFAGLKPLLIILLQLPVLIALFHVLGTAFELRNAGFLWINTLAEPDKLFSFGFDIPLLGSYFNLLPVLMSLFTLLSFRLAPSPSAEDKGKGFQNLSLIAMTLVFFFLFYSFPSGLVLYWTFANIFHIIQQKIMV